MRFSEELRRHFGQQFDLQPGGMLHVFGQVIDALDARITYLEKTVGELSVTNPRFNTLIQNVSGDGSPGQVLVREYYPDGPVVAVKTAYGEIQVKENSHLPPGTVGLEQPDHSITFIHNLRHTNE